MAEEGSGMIDNDPCWYCHCPPGDDLVFSWEFDTYVHLSCLRERIEHDPSDREAHIMGRELGLPGVPPHPTWDGEDLAATQALPDVDALF
jgi:hypothetical protein